MFLMGPTGSRQFLSGSPSRSADAVNSTTRTLSDVTQETRASGRCRSLSHLSRRLKCDPAGSFSPLAFSDESIARRYRSVVELRLLKSFVAVAEELHFGRAAARLHISQPPLTVQIQRLEHDLGVMLFVRTNRRVLLTEAGHALLGRARHLLVEAELAANEVRRVGRGETGRLVVGYNEAATYSVLPTAVHRFRSLHPQTELELCELHSAHQIDALTSGRIEVALVCLPILNSDLVVRVVHADGPVVALPNTHLLAGLQPIPVDRLAGEPAILIDPTIEPSWANASQQALSRANVTLRIVQRTDSKNSMLALVAAGLGLSVVSAATRVLARDGVTFRDVSNLDVCYQLGAVTATTPTLRAAAFIDGCDTAVTADRHPA